VLFSFPMRIYRVNARNAPRKSCKSCSVCYCLVLRKTGTMSTYVHSPILNFMKIHPATTCAPDDIWWVWSSRWNENWQGKPRSTLWKPAPVLFRLPQIPHDLNWARTRADAVGSWRLTAWAMARPSRTVLAVIGWWWSWKPTKIHGLHRAGTSLFRQQCNSKIKQLSDQA
jgi:hypothetical protein